MHDEIVDVVRLGRLIALQKPWGRERNCCWGHHSSCSHDLPKVGHGSGARLHSCAPSPPSLAWSASHTHSRLTDLDDRATVLSIDGIGAQCLKVCDQWTGAAQHFHLSCSSMGTPPSHWWTMTVVSHTRSCRAKEGSRVTHWSQCCARSSASGAPFCPVPPRRRQSFVGLHDHIYIVSQLERVGDIHAHLRDELWQHSRIQIPSGKTPMWNRGGFDPPGHAALLEAARATPWFGDLADPAKERGIAFSAPKGLG